MGIVYVLSNPSLHGQHKVGFTLNSVKERLSQLNGSTSIPTKFVVEYYVELKDDDSYLIERATHAELHRLKFHHGKEFFKCTVGQCREAIAKAIAENNVPVVFAEDGAVTRQVVAREKLRIDADRTRQNIAAEAELKLKEAESNIQQRYEVDLSTLSDPGEFIPWWIGCGLIAMMVVSGLSKRISDGGLFFASMVLGLVGAVIAREWVRGHKQGSERYIARVAVRDRELAAVRGSPRSGQYFDKPHLPTQTRDTSQQTLKGRGFPIPERTYGTPLARLEQTKVHAPPTSLPAEHCVKNGSNGSTPITEKTQSVMSGPIERRGDRPHLEVRQESAVSEYQGALKLKTMDDTTENYGAYLVSLVTGVAYQHEDDESRDVESVDQVPSLDINQLALDKLASIRNALENRLPVPPETIAALMDDSDAVDFSELSLLALRHPNCPEETIREWLTLCDVESPEALAIAENPSCPADELGMLWFWNAGDSYVSLAVKRNPAFSSHVLNTTIAEKLDGSIEDRRQLAGRTDTPPKILEQLAVDSHWTVRKYVAQNQSTPLHTLEKLAKRQIKADVSHELDDELFDKLTDETETEDWDLEENWSEYLPAIVRQYAQTNPSNTTFAATQNAAPTVPSDLISYDSGFRLSCAKLSEHPDLDVRWKIAYDIRTPEDVLRKLASDYVDTIRSAVAANESCPIDAFLDLAHDPVGSIRVAVAENKRCSTEALASLAASPFPEYRRLAAKHMNCSIDVFRQLARDSDREVLDYVSKNKNCPIDIRAPLYMKSMEFKK